jgi:hypothetical protein
MEASAKKVDQPASDDKAPPMFTEESS